MVTAYTEQSPLP